MNKKVWVILLMAFSIVGCNTVSGVGKDIQKAGESIEDASGK